MEEDKLGDIFWDLASWIYYIAGYELGCIIYVVNDTDVEREYALISRTYRNGVLQNEGTIQVHGYTWFAVSPEDFIKLYGTLKLDESDVTLTVNLIEKETQETTDSVSAALVTPTSAAMPPGWNIPGVPTTPTSDWMSIMITMMIVVMMMKMMTSALGLGEKEKIAQRI